MYFTFMTFSTPELTVPEIIAAAKKFGYDGVEFRINCGHRHGVEPDADPAYLARVREDFAAAGLKIGCIASDGQFAVPAKAPAQVESVKKVIALAAAVGAPVIRVFGGLFPDTLSRAEAKESCVASLRALAPTAQAAGVTLCMETHDAWCDPRQVLEVIEAVGSPAVAANWDIMHPVVRAQTGIEKSFEILKNHIRHVHVHDGAFIDGDVPLAPIGTGVINHRKALELLAGAGYEGAVSGEWIGWESWETHLPREIKALRSYLK